MAIITAAQYKTFKGISDTTYDAQLAVVVPAAQAVAERYCNRVFDIGTFTELHDGDGSDTLILKNAPIVSITSIKLVDSAGTVLSTYASTDYVLTLVTAIVKLYDSRYGRLVHDSFGILQNTNWGNQPYWPRGTQNIQVVYSGGYTSAPADLQLAMYLYVDSILSAATAAVGTGTYQSERLGNYSYALAMASQKFEAFRHLFAPWRRLVAA